MTRLPHVPVPFTEARTFVLTFGQHQGKPLDKIAESDAGLLYLDWMRGALRLDYHTRNAVCSYLDDETIAKDLAELVERKGRHR